MIEQFAFVALMFYAIPVIALFDWVMFGGITERNALKVIEDYKKGIMPKSRPFDFLYATIIEVFCFIAGFVLALGLRS